MVLAYFDHFAPEPSPELQRARRGSATSSEGKSEDEMEDESSDLDSASAPTVMAADDELASKIGADSHRSKTEDAGLQAWIQSEQQKLEGQK